jgi:hypothetical protein
MAEMKLNLDNGRLRRDLEGTVRSQFLHEINRVQFSRQEARYI